jgi:RNA polymerase sigma-70 factor (ECF subfamily)
MKESDGHAAADRAKQQERESEQAAATALVERIRNGDERAEGELVARYSRPLLFMLRRRTGDPALADDLHQDAFRIVIERLRDRGINEPARLAGFIQSTGRNLVIGAIRRRQRRQTYADSDTVEATADEAHGGQADAVDAAQAALHVHRLLKQLGSERDRAILIRFFLYNEDKASICDGLGLSAVHFNRVLYRAKKRFREVLEDSDDAFAREWIAGRE